MSNEQSKSVNTGAAFSSHCNIPSDHPRPPLVNQRVPGSEFIGPLFFTTDAGEETENPGRPPHNLVSEIVSTVATIFLLVTYRAV